MPTVGAAKAQSHPDLADTKTPLQQPAGSQVSLASLAITAAWWTNITALVTLVIWLSIDGFMSRFEIDLIPGFTGQILSNGILTEPEGLTESYSIPRRIFGTTVLSFGGLSALTVAIGLLLGPAQYRTLRTFLVALLLVTLWVLTLSNWKNIVELGKAIRVSQEVAPLESFAQSTLKQWETLTDEKTSPDYSKWTPFNAYPVNKPTMLFFLGEQPIPYADLKIRSIEYSRGQAIRFELAGEQIGNWLELRIDDEPPQDFSGGLDTPFEAMKWRRLRNKLYLVRYR